jgi:hypothetical protein
VDPVSDPLLLRKSGSAGNRTWASGSVARNSDHWTTEAAGLKVNLQNYPRLAPQFLLLVFILHFK